MNRAEEQRMRRIRDLLGEKDKEYDRVSQIARKYLINYKIYKIIYNILHGTIVVLAAALPFLVNWHPIQPSAQLIAGLNAGIIALYVFIRPAARSSSAFSIHHNL